MTEKQKKLVEDYGPRFVSRSSKIRTELLHLTADAVSVMTDDEWAPCAESLIRFVDELEKAKSIVVDRMKEAGLPVR